MAKQMQKKPRQPSVGARPARVAPRPVKNPTRTYRVKVALVMPITVQASSREQAVRLARDKAMDDRMDWDDRFYEAMDAELDGKVGFYILRVD